MATSTAPDEALARTRGGRLARRQRAVAYGLLGPGGFWLIVFFLLPVALMVYTSLETGGTLSGGYSYTFPGDWGNYPEVLSQYSTQFIRSLTYAGLATAIALLVAYPMTYWIAFHGGRRKGAILLLILLPFFVSFVIRTVQWKFILGDTGLIFGPLKDLGWIPEDFRVLATPLAVVAGITYNFLPFTALPLYVSLEQIDKRLVEAAKDLYASKWTAFRKVVLPLSIPGIFAAVLLTFVPATGDYINSTVLGGPGTTMIGNIIQDQFLVQRDYPEAAALSAILMLGMLILASIYARILGTDDASLAGAVG
ncbi:MAG: ABC transporter permease [Actinomycetota bacterium]